MVRDSALLTGRRMVPIPDRPSPALAAGSCGTAERTRHDRAAAPTLAAPASPPAAHPPAPVEAHERAALAEIEPVLARLGARYAADLRALSAAVARRYEAQLAAKEAQLAELSRDLAAARTRADELERAHAELRGLLAYVAHELGTVWRGRAAPVGGRLLGSGAGLEVTPPHERPSSGGRGATTTDTSGDAAIDRLLARRRAGSGGMRGPA